MLWLKNLNACPPGEFFYRQSEAPGKTFGPSPLINTVAGLVSDFRKGNNLPGSDHNTVLTDIIKFTVNRLPPNSEWVIETEQAWLPASSTGGSCAGCGASV